MKKGIIALIILLFLLVYTIYTTYEARRSSIKSEELIDYQLDVIRNQTNREFESIKYSNHYLHDIMVTNIINDTIKLSHIIEDNNMLIIRKPKFGCGDCFSDILDIIKPLLDEIGNKIFLLSFVDLADVQSYAKLIKLDSSTVFNYKEPLISRLDSITSFYLLSVNEKLKIESVYIGENGKNERIKEFIKSFKRSN